MHKCIRLRVYLHDFKGLPYNSVTTLSPGAGSPLRRNGAEIRRGRPVCLPWCGMHPPRFCVVHLLIVGDGGSDVRGYMVVCGENVEAIINRSRFTCVFIIIATVSYIVRSRTDGRHTFVIRQKYAKAKQGVPCTPRLTDAEGKLIHYRSKLGKSMTCGPSLRSCFCSCKLRFAAIPSFTQSKKCVFRIRKPPHSVGFL